MAGHSKWANIKHRKEKQDAIRGRIFTKLIREITSATKSGGQDINANSRLRVAVDTACLYNMPRDTINRAIQRGTKSIYDGEEEILYGGYAPGGVAILVKCLTNNRARTAGEIRHIFDIHGGNFGATDSVSYIFNQLGLIYFPINASDNDENKIIQFAMDINALDVITNNDNNEIKVIISCESFSKAKSIIAKYKLQITSANISMIPSIWVSLDENASIIILDLIDKLQCFDDVQDVYSNMKII